MITVPRETAYSSDDDFMYSDLRIELEDLLMLEIKKYNVEFVNNPLNQMMLQCIDLETDYIIDINDIKNRFGAVAQNIYSRLNGGVIQRLEIHLMMSAKRTTMNIAFLFWTP